MVKKNKKDWESCSRLYVYEDSKEFILAWGWEQVKRGVIARPYGNGSFAFFLKHYIRATHNGDANGGW